MIFLLFTPFIAGIGYLYVDGILWGIGAFKPLIFIRFFFGLVFISIILLIVSEMGSTGLILALSLAWFVTALVAALYIKKGYLKEERIGLIFFRIGDLAIYLIFAIGIYYFNLVFFQHLFLRILLSVVAALCILIYIYFKILSKEDHLFFENTFRTIKTLLNL